LQKPVYGSIAGYGGKFFGGLLNECMNSGSPSLAGKGLGVRSAQSPREIDLSLNPSPTGEGL
jgi:hypothetical protein